MIKACGDVWPCGGAQGFGSSMTGHGNGNWSGFASGGPTLSGGFCPPATISVADVDGHELAVIGCNGADKQFIGYKVAVFK